jgi:exonuclease SbcC
LSKRLVKDFTAFLEYAPDAKDALDANDMKDAKDASADANDVSTDPNESRVDVSGDNGVEIYGKKIKALLEQAKTDETALSAQKSIEEKSFADLTKAWEAATKRSNDSESGYVSAKTLVKERSSNERSLSRLKEEAFVGYNKALKAAAFTEVMYLDALLTEDELVGLKAQLSDYDSTGKQLVRDVLRLEKETAEKERPDPEMLQANADAANALSIALNEERDQIKSSLDKTQSALKELRTAAVAFEQAEKAYAAVRQLSDTANGKQDFETYAQLAYFERVLRAANLRLNRMSQNRYILLRKEEGRDRRSKTGLDIEVLDAFTGKTRSANSLSGGESFMASLSLALGLSDAVQYSAGGIHLDAMFIDEGFGALDVETLDLALRTLQEMAGANRCIGIISHVPELRERIEKQILIEKTTAGSKITMSV